MPQNPVCWFEIYVEDIERARRFYEAVLQVKLEKLNSTVPELWAFPQSFADYGAAGALAQIVQPGDEYGPFIRLLVRYMDFEIVASGHGGGVKIGPLPLIQRTEPVDMDLPLAVVAVCEGLVEHLRRSRSRQHP